MTVSNLPDGYVELPYDRVVVEGEKGSAHLIDFGFVKKWIPESQVYDMFEDGEGNTIILTEWIANKKGLI